MTNVDTMAARLARIRQRIAQACERAGRAPDSVTLLPISKTFEVAALREAMALGLTRFGESKTQELRQKAAALAGQGLQWVLIGHLQTNKAKDAARDAIELQSLDRLDLAETLHRRLLEAGRTLDVLVQVKTSPDPGKYGLAPAELPRFLRRIATEFPTLRVQGLMTLAAHSPDPLAVRACFQCLRQWRDRLRQEDIAGVSLERLSMGMSGDFEWAIAEGSTEVRIGSALFGARTQAPPGQP